jgi:hypothetical protein
VRFPFFFAVVRQRRGRGGIGLFINCFLHIRCSSHESPHSHPNRATGLYGSPKPVSNSFCTMQSERDPITYLIFLQEMILDHFTQMLLCEENRYRAWTVSRIRAGACDTASRLWVRTLLCSSPEPKDELYWIVLEMVGMGEFAVMNDCNAHSRPCR